MRGRFAQSRPWFHGDCLSGAGPLRSLGYLGLCLALVLWGLTLQGAEARLLTQHNPGASRCLLEEPAATEKLGRVEAFQNLLKVADTSPARPSKFTNSLVVPLLGREDEELFAKAVATKPASGSPPRIAYLFLARGALHMARLWERFFLGQPEELYSIYIHASERNSTYEEQLPEVLRGRHVRSEPTVYRTVTIIDGERRLLANALLDPRNTHFTLLCEKSVPLFNFSFVYEHLTSLPKSLLVNYPSNGFRWTEEFLPLIPKAEWGKGAAWFSLQRKHVRMVVADRKYYSYFKAIRLSNGYDEHYYQTLLYHLDPQGFFRWTPMAIHWRSGPHFRMPTTHPDTFHSWRIGPGLIADLAGPWQCKPGHPERWMCHVFARKFSPTAVETLLQLLPLQGVPTRAKLARMAEEWFSPRAVQLPQGGMPGAGRTTGSYLEAWRGQVGENKKGRGRGSGRKVPSALLSQEEEELFGRALAVEPAGAPRVAFLFLVREEFLLAPLWTKFFQGQLPGDFSLYMYAGEEHNPASLPEVFRAATIIRPEAASGNHTTLQGARRLLGTALLDDRNSHFLLLCEATVPLFNFTFTYTYITQTPYSFVDSMPGSSQHWPLAFERLFPQTDWRVGEPWGAMLQRPHAALVVADTAYYQVWKEAGLDDSSGARSYFATLIQRHDPGSFFGRSLAHASLPTLQPSPRDPNLSPITFYYWDVGPGFITDMASPHCPYISTRGGQVANTGERRKEPCFLFLRRMHWDALDRLLGYLPATIPH